MSNELRQKLAGKRCTFPNRRPIRRVKDGAPGFWGRVEENKQRAKADPCGMTNKRTSNGKSEMRGSLHSATDGEAVRRFGRDDGFSGWAEENRHGNGLWF
jgi:hypothetical protein